jgi:hypothetical protein
MTLIWITWPHPENNFAHETNLHMTYPDEPNSTAGRDERTMLPLPEPDRKKLVWRRINMGLAVTKFAPHERTSLNFAWLDTAKHTLHPGTSMTKLVTTRWVQGVRDKQKDSHSH